MIAKLINPYCTLKDVQRETENTNANDRGDMVNAINDASRYIDEYCRRDFLFHDYSSLPLTVKESWCAENVIWLPWPVITLTQVQASDFLNDLALLDPSMYQVENTDRGIGKIMRYGRWARGDVHAESRMLNPRIFCLPRVILLTGTFGYAAPTGLPPNYAPAEQADGQDTFDATQWPPLGIPMNIRRACAVIAAVWSGKLRKEIVNFAAATTQQITQKTIPDAVMAMLRAYRRPAI